MRLNELRFSTNPTTKKWMFHDLSNVWVNMSLENGETLKKIGYISGYSLFQCKENNHEIIQIFDNINKVPAGYIEFNLKGKAHVISETSVDKPYLGLGLATKVYAYLIKIHNYILWNVDAQTAGGKSIWEKLALISGILVFAWDNNKKEAISLDNHELTSDVDIYGADVEYDRDKVSKLQHELQNKIKEISLLKSNKNKLIMQQQLQNIFKQIKKLRAEEIQVENDITLVACRAH